MLITLFQQAAPAAPSAGSSLMQSLLLFGPLILIFYFLILRPQNKRMKAHRELIAGIQKNDMVITNGGIIGKVKKVGEEEVTITSSTSELKIARSMIASVQNKTAAND